MKRSTVFIYTRAAHDSEFISSNSDWGTVWVWTWTYLYRWFLHHMHECIDGFPTHQTGISSGLTRHLCIWVNPSIPAHHRAQNRHLPRAVHSHHSPALYRALNHLRYPSCCGTLFPTARHDTPALCPDTCCSCSPTVPLERSQKSSWSIYINNIIQCICNRI